MELNENDDFEAILIRMSEVHRRKSADYTGEGGDPLQNFIDQGYQTSMSPGETIEVLIAVKQARLRVLLPQHLSHSGEPQNEGIQDTLLDRAVYSVIALEAWDAGLYEGSGVPVLERP